MPTATATTHSVNSSREPVLEICHSTHGSTRRPPTSISATKAATASSVCASVSHRLSPPAPPSARPTSAGSSTSTSTIARSSTISQPTAMRPFCESSTPRDSSARNSTTVLATESEMPNTSAPPADQPTTAPGPRPSRWPRPSAPRHRNGDAAHRHQVGQREVQAHAEHQQHDADLGQLRGQVHVGDEARGVRADQHAGQQVATRAGRRSFDAQKPSTSDKPRAAAIVTIRGMLGCIGTVCRIEGCCRPCRRRRRAIQPCGGVLSMKLWRTASLSYSFCRLG